TTTPTPRCPDLMVGLAECKAYMGVTCTTPMQTQPVMMCGGRGFFVSNNGLPTYFQFPCTCTDGTWGFPINSGGPEVVDPTKIKIACVP
ncbi:hypothetical protein PENTCL1PPCAC_24446, partial [Pristionchus entomophagus]